MIDRVVIDRVVKATAQTHPRKETTARARYLWLLLIAALPAMGQLPCPDNGESSSKRTITPVHSVRVDLKDVPKALQRAAQERWHMDFVRRDFPAPATGIHVTGARVFRFPEAVFYLVQVNGEDESLFSAKCPQSWCAPGNWWTRQQRLFADQRRPPSALPGDEFYVRTPGLPKNAATLLTSPADDEHPHYALNEECVVTITEVNP